MFNVAIGKYNLSLVSEGLPDLYNDYVKHATFVDEIDIHNSEGKNCFISVSRGGAWPFFIVAQRYSPAGYGFNPGVLLASDTDILFVGAGERLLAYDLAKPGKLWEDVADTGFWFWARYDRFVLMSAELEFAAWDIQGKKLWSTFVEPPWKYKVDGFNVILDVIGEMQTFRIEQGP